MKSLMLALCALALPFALCAADPVVGDARELVIKQLGKPKGRAHSGSVETLAYDRGVVELNTGLVTRVRLVTPEQLTQRTAAQEAAARAAAEQLRERVAAGEKAREELLQDDAYRTNSAAVKVVTWEQFRQEHPDVAPPAEFQQAVSDKAEDERLARQSADLAAALAAAQAEPRPRLSASKRRKMGRRVTDDSDAPSATPYNQP